LDKVVPVPMHVAAPSKKVWKQLLALMWHLLMYATLCQNYCSELEKETHVK